jgi:hypothetical protein
MRRLVLILAAALVPALLVAQQSPKAKTRPPSTTLPAILSTFLADSGVATRGLPWTTGNTLPIKWKSVQPVPSQYTMYNGVTSERTGTTRFATSDTSSIAASVTVLGNADGVQRFWVQWDMNEFPSERGDSLLLKAGFVLTPTKCSRATEGYSYGNLLMVVKAPGKKAAGMQEGWNCAQNDCTVTVSLYYRKADAEKIECVGS